MVAARGDRVAVAGADQAEELALRPVGAKRLALGRPAQVVGQHRALAHGEHAGLGPRVGQRGDVAGGKHAGVRHRLQGVVDADEAPFVNREPGLAGPAGRSRFGHPDDRVGGYWRVVAGVHGLGGDGGHRASGVQVDAALGQDTGEAAPDTGVVGRQDLRAAGQQREANPVGILASGAQIAAQAVLRGQREFDAAGAAPHHRDPERSPAGQHALAQRLPSGQEAVYRLGGQGVLGGTGYVEDARARAGVDRQQVVADRRTARHAEFAVFEVDTVDFGVVEPGACEACQRPQIDVTGVVVVMPGDVAWQHAGVGGVDVAGDEREPQPGFGLHAEAAQHGHVGVAAADQHDILDHGNSGALHRQ